MVHPRLSIGVAGAVVIFFAVVHVQRYLLASGVGGGNAKRAGQFASNSCSVHFRCEAVIRVQYDGERLYTVDDCDKTPTYVGPILKLLREVVQRLPCGATFDLFANLGDLPVLPAALQCDPVPVLSFQAHPDYRDIPFPYQTLHMERFGLESVPDWCSKAMLEGLPSWSSRLPVAVWRGTQTGGSFTENNYMTFGRSKLVSLCSKHQSDCDAAWSGFSGQVTDAAKDEINRTMRMASPVALHEFGRWKYVISADGNGWAARLPYLMCTGSVVLKQRSPFAEYWYDHLIPGVHYVELDPGFSDLLDTVQWLRAHDDEAKRIGEAGKELVKRLLTPDRVAAYAASVLNDISRRWPLKRLHPLAVRVPG